MRKTVTVVIFFYFLKDLLMFASDSVADLLYEYLFTITFLKQLMTVISIILYYMTIIVFQL